MSYFTNKPKTLRVGALQLTNTLDMERNILHATPAIEAAVRRGASLIILPELYTTGYTCDEQMWENAERMEDGPTRTWLTGITARLNVHIGASFLEASGEHFYNTFIICHAGDVVGVVRKQVPSALEAYLFAPAPGGVGSHIIPCPALGLRVGVGICYETHLSFLADSLVEERADILVMPHSCPNVERVPEEVMLRFRSVVLGVPKAYAVALGIPTIFVNKAGAWSSTMLGWGGEKYFKANFIGGTQVVDWNGEVVSIAPKQSDQLLVSDVRIAPSDVMERGMGVAAFHNAVKRTLGAPRAKYRTWLGPTMPWFLQALFTANEVAGELFYRSNIRRKRAALRISLYEGDAPPPEWQHQRGFAYLSAATVLGGGAAIFA
eukprot:CAMPEP_0182871724 /NCGR_PEP_ID=MMETSP0034_2-20130328/11286_1 /TAXON_ID=156128 /ORGANISM="Nephroselmis pyriformis, Strain CCMP717" /LENGTH=377 /DNA_ID=CAMNT_0025004285 /DNA_START=1 /DNA_END=1131 /DNA_ORIENTATION=+